MPIKIALVGNPNSGKTTLFNELTGSKQYVGNWPGVTVEKKEGMLKGYSDVTIVDLPGIYSLSPYSAEEVVSRNFLLNENVDLIIDIVDAANIERNLYLTTQVIETKVPVIIALNMMDVIEKQGDKISIEKLAEQLKCPIVEISALKNKNISKLIDTCIKRVGEHTEVTIPTFYENDLTAAIAQIGTIINDVAQGRSNLFYSVKLFEKDALIRDQLSLSETQISNVNQIITAVENKLEDDSESIITDARYQFIAGVVNSAVKKNAKTKLTTSDKIDRVVTNKWLALPIFALLMYVAYYFAITTVGDLSIGFIENFFEWVGTMLTNGLQAIGASETIIRMLIEGALGGVTSVMSFVPQMMILFFFISLLEDSGYMARVAFIMDRVFRKFGLSGKSFIPFIIGTGCSVPAIMSSRTIENEKDRRMTIILTPFIPCGAKLPVFALMIAAFFPDSPWVGPSMYFIGIIMVIISGVLLKRTKWFAGEPAPFIMELPPYRFPSFKGVFIHMWERGKLFITKAGTIILAMSILIWVSLNFNTSFHLIEEASQDTSLLAAFGRVFAPVFAPLGYGHWQAAVAQVTGLLAKETMVATFGILAGGLGEGTAELSTWVNTLIGSQAAAYSFMIFTLLAAPCMAAIGATKRELVRWGDTLKVVAYQCGLAYLMAMIAYQIRLFDLVSGALSAIGQFLSPVFNPIATVVGYIFWPISKLIEIVTYPIVWIFTNFFDFLSAQPIYVIVIILAVIGYNVIRKFMNIKRTKHAL